MGYKAVSFLLRFVQFLCALLLFAAAVASWYSSRVSPEAGRFWVTLGLLMPVLLLLNLAAMIWWLFRGRWRLSLLPAAALVWNLGYVASMVRLPGPIVEEPADLRVATLNTLGFRRFETPERSAFAVARTMAREGVDILCLQEFPVGRSFPADSIAALFRPQMPYMVCDEGEAIVSRYPILDHRYVRFPDSGNDYLWADVRVGDKTVRVLSVHLQTSGVNALRHRFRKDYNRDAPVERVLGEVERNSRIRARQVREICALADSVSGPLILAGDFNDTPSSYTYREVRSRLEDGFREAGGGYGGTFRYLGGVLRIDYIFYNDFFRCVAYRTLPDDLSDHRAVVAELQFRR